ncbi:hypothetical protein F4803DRAFT_555060 [Xylaria telfairii]|nr:hypothetical protein F4803DRAFT_555060 [Xylaria telfairii]
MTTPGGNANAGSVSTSPSPATYFDVLPTEILLIISEELYEPDRIRLALTLPQVFMNSNRLNVFVVDCVHQLNIRTYRLAHLPPAVWLDHVRRLRHPLILDAIHPDEGDHFRVDEIEIILNEYETECTANGIDPHAFLNSVFPDHRPADVPPPSNGPYTLDLMTPLHMAVEAGRVDVVQYLIRRGADPRQTCFFWVANASRTPLQRGIDLAAQLTVSPDRTQSLRIEDAALELARFSTTTAYEPNSDLTEDMRRAVFACCDRLVLLFLQRYQNLDNVDRSSDSFQTARNELLSLVLTSMHPMPQTISYMLANGGNFRFINRNVWVSVTSEALGGGNPFNIIGNPVNIATALEWELETHAPELHDAINSLYGLATDDTNIDVVRMAANVLIRRQYLHGQSRLLHASIVAGPNAAHTREYLLNAVSSDLLDGHNLRAAIQSRDSRTAGFIRQSMLSRGQSIDDPLTTARDLGHVGYWFHSPLTFSLTSNNYLEAAILLSLGADINRIPAAVRQQVSVVRDRIITGDIENPAAFVYNTLDPHALDVNAAELALSYVFARLLDDPSRPLPNPVT